MKFITKSHDNSFVGGLCKLFDALVQISTFGFLYGSLAMEECRIRTKRKIQKMLDKERQEGIL